MKVKVDAFELASGGREAVGNFRITGTRQLQIDLLIRSDYVKIRDRKNQSITISFEVSREHSTVEDAEAFVLTHNLNVPTSGLVEFSSETGAVKTWFEAAVVQTVDTSYIGVTTKHSYQMTGGEMLLKKP